MNNKKQKMQCYICMQADPPTTRMGCACRSDSGFAHVACLVTKATYLEDARALAWHRCETCDHDYTGETATALAEELYSRVRGLCALHPRRLEAAHQLADALVRGGRYEEAEVLCRDALALMEAEFGPEDPQTALAQGSMAECLKYRGRYAEDAPHRMRLENSEALLLLYRRQFVESERAFRKLLAMERRVLGADHPQTVTTAANLALCLTSMGRHAEAMPMETEVLAQRTQIQGAEHPETLTSKTNQADCVQWCGELERAEQLHREVLRSRRRALGDAHCDTLSSGMLLCGALIAQHKGEEAECVIRAVIAIIDARTDMPNDKAAAHSLLAIAMSSQRKYAEARERMKAVVRMCADAYGDDDMHTREARELVLHMESVELEATCVRCGAPARGACAQCGKTLYCSRGCQRADWRAHKPACALNK